MNCPGCQTTNPREAVFCLNCGFRFQFEQMPVAPPQPELRQGLALASLVMGTVSLFTCSLFFAGAFTAMALGVFAIVKANSNPEEYGGKGLAMGGIAMSMVSLLAGSFIAFKVIPTVIDSKIAVNEAAVAQSVYRAGYAQYEFYESRGKFGTLEELSSAGLIDESFLRKSIADCGYKLEVSVREKTFEIGATPTSYGWSGRRSFYMTTDYAIRAADKRGMAAGSRDPYYY